MHGKHKRICKECHGPDICEHNRQKQICKDCHGSGICIHNKHKRACYECKGIVKSTRSSNPLASHKKCEHNRETRDCKDCGGTRICEHGKRRNGCSLCKSANLIAFNAASNLLIAQTESNIVTASNSNTSS